VRARRAAAGLLATGVAALAVIPAVSGASTKPVRKTVKVGDDFFLPVKLTVPKDSTIVWKWPAANVNTHDVKLKRGPKGVRHFHSDPAAADFSYKRKLKVRGKYFVICTFHEDMDMTIYVK
jgi:plastocyanin